MINPENIAPAPAAAIHQPIALKQLLWPAFFASLIAAAAASLSQQAFVVPSILQAELIEAGGSAHHAVGAAVHAGIERTAFTVLFNWLTAFGYALLLAVCFGWTRTIGWRAGLWWGIAGFVSFALAPALGLPPELPGTHAADLAARQTWWVGTAWRAPLDLPAFSSAPAADQVDRRRTHCTSTSGRAPVLPEGDSAVPAEMTRAFVAGSLGQSLLMWLLLGALTAVFMSRFSPRTPDVR